MNSTCVSSCLDAQTPVRATYLNLYKWPESDAEFVKSMSSESNKKNHPRIVDSYSCRQMYLRSYTFCKKESVPEKTKKCLGRVRNRVYRKKKKNSNCHMRRMKENLVYVSCAAFFSIFHRLLSCTTSVEVVDHL